MRIGIIGATGLVGDKKRELLEILAELDGKRLPVDELRLFASERSAGQTKEWRGRDLLVEDATSADYSDLDIVLISAGAQASRDLAPVVAAAGAFVIDNSSAWRMDPEVPLVVSEVNPDALNDIPTRIVANPNCTTMVAMPVVKPLHDEAGLVSLTASTYQAVSGAGRNGISELLQQVRALAELKDDEFIALASDGAKIEGLSHVEFSHPIAFNVLPHAGEFVGDGSGETVEEVKLRQESRKILGLPDLRVSATCVRVPVITGHSLSISLEFEQELTPEQATHILSRASGVRLTGVPTPAAATGKDPSLVGRIRRDETRRNGLSLFLSGDNLRKGAALNAVELAGLVYERYLRG